MIQSRLWDTAVAERMAKGVAEGMAKGHVDEARALCLGRRFEMDGSRSVTS